MTKKQRTNCSVKATKFWCSCYKTYNNKFVMQWKKLYQILQKLGSNGYKISDGKEKNYYYANMLKNYYAREDETENESENEEVELKEKIPRIYEKSLLEFGTCRQKKM